MTAVEAQAVPGISGQVSGPVIRQFGRLVEEWSAGVSRLASWQDAALLDAPSPENLARNGEAIREMLRLGRVLARATDDPDFPDPALGPQVQAALEVLGDMERAWSRPPGMTLAEADALLARCGL